jgi:lipid II:glycine glycyltransferase (peptidoglycan interpeptide bridge formation enzyme)
LPGIVLKKRTNHRLPLIAVYDKLAATYNDNTKRNLKKAREAKLEAFENADPTSIIKLYTDNYAAKTPEVQAADYTRLKRLVNTAIKMGGLKAWGVYDAHNTLCAGALFLTDHKNVYYLLGGADDSGKEAGAMYALFDAFIERHAAHDLVLDFEGSDIEGIARFYRGFGAKTVNYYGLKQNLMP